MEVSLACCIREIFMVTERTVPPSLSKYLSNNMFDKPNKAAMEHVLYHLLLIIEPNCTMLPWPIATFKDAAEFRTNATRLINNLNGFIYEKSSNVNSKVNSSLLANPGGKIFICFMYQLCTYILCCELEKKGNYILNSQSYVEDEYIDKKITILNSISESNLKEINEMSSRTNNLENITESAIKWKEIIQKSKQCIKYFKSKLNVVHCQATENEVAELKQKKLNSFERFEQKKLIATRCARLASIILKTPEDWDANKINLISNVIDELLEYGKVDLVKLLTFIKNSIKNYVNYCEKLDDEEIKNKIFKTQQYVIDMTKKKKYYEEIMNKNSNLINDLNIENEKLEKEVFTNKYFEKVDPRLQLLYQIPPVNLSNITNKSESTSEDNKSSRKSIFLQCSDTPIEFQRISYDTIKEIYKATQKVTNQNDVAMQDVIESNLNQSDQVISLKNSCEISQNTFAIFKKQELLATHINELEKTDSLNKSLQPQNKEDEVKNVFISRKSIENIKQKFNRIKNQATSTIPHSPESPLFEDN